jgi:hypothetical protein
VKPYKKSTSTKRLGDEILQKTKELSVNGSLGNFSPPLVNVVIVFGSIYFNITHL